MIGAQVFIEPGQSKEDIEHWFKTLADLQMPVCRIRLFQDHMQQPDGSYDYSLYDHAFDMAAKFNVKVFATLFPSTTSVGGFKFPSSEAHLKEIARYIEAMATHFGKHPALWVWVLQNEPGAGKAPDDDFTCEKVEEFMRQRQLPAPRNNYARGNLDPEMFLREYTYCYLNWIAYEISQYDEQHDFHVNNHMLFSLLPEYDFSKWMEFLHSLGASMHPSWHFGFFERDQYPLAISANCEIIHDAAQPKPFWVTELQGGNNLYSGYYPMNPTREDIAQWQWTSIGAGAKGIIYWSLNARATEAEAGEWAMLNFQGQPSDRLLEASEIAGILQKNKDFFSNAKPETAAITIVYSPESMMVEARQSLSDNIPNDFEGRKKGAHIKSALGYFEALQELGVCPDFMAMEDYDWTKATDQPRLVILPHVLAIPHQLIEGMETFVRNGNKLIVSGLTGFYDENIHNVMLTGFPLQDLFGGNVKEFKVVENYFDLKLDDPAIVLPAHLWRGTLQPTTGKPIGSLGEEVIGIRNKFGKGEVVWVPSMLGLGAWQNNNVPLAGWLEQEAYPQIDCTAFRFGSHTQGVIMRLLKNADEYCTILINSKQEPATVELNSKFDLSPEIIDGITTSQEFRRREIRLAPQETLVILWK